MWEDPKNKKGGDIKIEIHYDNSQNNNDYY